MQITLKRKYCNSQKNGKFLREIGGAGNEPGLHLFPTSVGQVYDNLIGIPDFQGHRVNLFDFNGDFKRSFTYTPQNFSAQQIIFSKSTNSIFLFGNKWNIDEDENITGSTQMHRYSIDGEYIESFIDFPNDFKSLDLYNYSFSFVDYDNESVYMAMPFDYKVYRLDSGKVISLLSSSSSKFVPPSEKLDPSNVAPSEIHNFVELWRLKWTPISNISVFNGKLIVQYQTLDPLRYTIDIWDINKNKLLQSVNTNHLLLHRDDQNNFYFLVNMFTRDQKTYEILKVRPINN